MMGETRPMRFYALFEDERPTLVIGVDEESVSSGDLLLQDRRISRIYGSENLVGREFPGIEIKLIHSHEVMSQLREQLSLSWGDEKYSTGEVKAPSGRVGQALLSILITVGLTAWLIFQVVAVVTKITRYLFCCVAFGLREWLQKHKSQ